MKVTNPSLNLDAAAPLFVIINYQSPKFVRFIDKVWKQIWDCHPINKNMSTRILKFHFGIVTKLMISTLDDEKHVFLQKLNQCLSRGVHGVVQCDFGPFYFYFYFYHHTARCNLVKIITALHLNCAITCVVSCSSLQCIIVQFGQFWIGMFFKILDWIGIAKLGFPMFWANFKMLC